MEALTVEALLLRAVDVAGEVFERTWHVTKNYEDPFERQSGIFAELDEEVKESLPCLRYHDGLHTIRII